MIILRTIATRFISFTTGYAISDIMGWISSWNPFDNEQEGFYNTALKYLGLAIIIVVGLGAYTLWTGKFFKR